MLESNKNHNVQQLPFIEPFLSLCMIYYVAGVLPVSGNVFSKCIVDIFPSSNISLCD